MPFVGRFPDGRRVDITRIRNPHEELESGSVLCQICGEPMIVVAGLIRAAHFRHYADSNCDGPFESHPESIAHLRGKHHIAQNVAKEYGNDEILIEYEVPIPMNWRDKGRIVDVLVTFPNGNRVAHEVQLASITTEQLRNRTDDYRRANIDVVWWLGGSADTDTNRAWCLEEFGVVFVLTRLAITSEDYRQVASNRESPRRRF